MSNIKRHTDVVSTMEEFEARHERGLYLVPWVVYIGNDNDGYNVMYSNSTDSSDINTSTLIESLSKRIEKLENERVYCYESEYEELLSNGVAWVTNLDGSRSEVVFDNKKTYCIYEEEGPEIPEESD